MVLRQDAVQLLAEGHPVELVEHGLVEALADAIGLRTLGLGSTVVDVLDREIELVLVPLRVAAVFAAAVGQHPAQRDAVLLVKRQHPVIQQIGRGDRRLDVVELGEANLGIGVDEGLLVDAAHPLQRADIKGVLGTAVAGTGAVELAMRSCRLSPSPARRAGFRSGSGRPAPPWPPTPSAAWPWY